MRAWSAAVAVFLLGVTAGTQPAPGEWAVADAIGQLGEFDYSTRIEAARTIRRASPIIAVPTLADAVATHEDGYVRYRALVLLTGFEDSRTEAVARALFDDPNDRLRAVAYAYFERHPDAGVTEPLLGALAKEESEFVRPAVVRALAARGREPEVRAVLAREATRGEDFFRSTVIEALGDYAADYALPVLVRIAFQPGPLQDDAILALGKIGESSALNAVLASQDDAPRSLQASIAAASCLLGVACDVQMDYLEDALQYAAAQEDYQEELRSISAALGAMAVRGRAEALAMLFSVGRDAPERARAPIALAIGTVALRDPALLMQVLGDEDDPAMALSLLVDAFDMFQEDFEEEQFYVAVRGTYWATEAGSSERVLAEETIARLEF
ncbi:MAG: hypothetical protein QGF21_02830, partial [Vicinamibacterales bacterium]|nr:hypothetical protein [Vicinamibacterales bacterium]MDP7670862.1 hypothetical protein [Vicinamibacterales bacterium]